MQSQSESQHICHQNHGNFSAAPNAPPSKIRIEKTASPDSISKSGLLFLSFIALFYGFCKKVQNR